MQPLSEFGERMVRYIAELEAVPHARRYDEVFYPGEIEARNDRRDREAGLLLPEDTITDIRKLADGLRSYGAAAHHLGIESRHERGRWKNNRAENSHRPTRRRKRKRQRFKSAGSARKFLSSHAAGYNTFNVRRHLASAQTHRKLRAVAMSAWREAVAAARRSARPRPFALVAWRRASALPGSIRRCP